MSVPVVPHEATADLPEKAFDYIVVGAGTAGCALVGSLAAELPLARIALVESGREAVSPLVSTPARWPKLMKGEFDFDYQTLPQASLGSRQVQYPRGRGLGGSSLTNVMLYSRGFKSDWDLMPAGWQSKDVEAVFESLEARLHLTDITAGAFGHAVAAAGEACALEPRTAGAWEVHGSTTRFKAMIDSRTGRRLDVYRALGANRSNVTVIQGSVARLLFQTRSRACGVVLSGKSGARRELHVQSSGEIVLCAGAVDTPKILQLSGIGPPQLLQKFNIEKVADLPVGQGLRDHTLYPLASLCKLWPSPKELSPNSVQGWIHDEPNGVQLVMIDGQSACDILPFGLVAPFTSPGIGRSCLRGLMRGVSQLLKASIACCPWLRRQLYRIVALNVCLVRPTSVGSVVIRSSNPSLPPAIDPKFLDSKEDKDAMRCGVETARRLLASSPLKEMVAADLSLGEKWEATNLKFTTSSYYHPTGTCRMGECVDSELRVLGLRGLRVADASVLPVHPRVGTAPACLVIGTRCAQLMVRASRELS
eukprot:TRINITY_DN51719_c0_g1_i1.p1 TRINITY_DN51719_c0_g1~~TRINITY_DN51719_c0_g1_i1.p1  ORF type:complete len:535 (+),score=66.32 TRINITY_DN51719_c0_g1_i1:54-1658(+)